ncbi:MAG TPA: thioesterase family protein [Gemmataceae bacterium]
MTEEFRTTRRVEFGDTDQAGIVHFANFFRYMEAAETEFLRSRGLSVSWSEGGRRYGFPRVSASCDYLRPARFEDVLEVGVALEKIGSKSLTFLFTFRKGDEVIARGRVSSVFCRETPGHGLESLEISDEIREKLRSAPQGP